MRLVSSVFLRRPREDQHGSPDEGRVGPELGKEVEAVHPGISMSRSTIRRASATARFRSKRSAKGVAAVASRFCEREPVAGQVRGHVNLKVAPSPGVESTQIFPPRPSTIRLTTARPMPVF